jgi:hypothetical protein
VPAARLLRFAVFCAKFCGKLYFKALAFLRGFLFSQDPAQIKIFPNFHQFSIFFFVKV